jgi:hypothetical protein
MRGTFFLGVIAATSAIAFVVSGCGEKKIDTNNGDGGGGSGPVGSASSSSAGGSGDGDESTSCADAIALVGAGTALPSGSGVLATPGDRDYFTFTAQAGQWITVFTVANPDDDPEMIDTVVRLFDEAGNEMLGESDDDVPRTSVDSELFYRVTADGTYCVELLEWSDWAGETPIGDTTFTYEVSGGAFDAEWWNQDTEPNESNGAAQVLTLAVDPDATTDFAAVGGHLESDTDVDWYSVTIPAGRISNSVYFMPPEHGSTGGIGQITWYDGNGNTPIGRLNYPAGADGFSGIPVTPEETYFIAVERELETTTGANDFYFLKLFPTELQNQQEVDDDANSICAAVDCPGAEEAIGEPNGTVMSHFIGGTAATADPDFWSFEASAGDEVAVSCSAWRAGSGARGVSFELYEDPASDPVIEEVETETADVLWSASETASNPAFVVTTTGTHYFAVRGGTQDPLITGDWYLCGIHVGPP